MHTLCCTGAQAKATRVAATVEREARRARKVRAEHSSYETLPLRSCCHRAPLTDYKAILFLCRLLIEEQSLHKVKQEQELLIAKLSDPNANM